MAELKYTLDTNEGMASLNIYVNDVLVTTYHYDNAAKTITLSPLVADVDLTREGLRENLRHIESWIALIYQHFKPGQLHRASFQERLRKVPVGDPKRITAYFEIDELFITDATYRINTELVTFLARPERTMPLACFVSWYEFLLRFHGEMEQF